MKHLYSWASWRVNESTDSEIEDIKRANTLFGNWIFQKVVKDIKVEVDSWEIPYDSYKPFKEMRQSTYKVKAITATYKGKRFFIGLNAPENHRYGMDFGAKPNNYAGKNGTWGRVYYLSVPPDKYRVMAHFYSGDEIKIEEPNQWYPTTSIKRLSNLFTKKIPPRNQIILTDLKQIVNSIFGYEIVSFPAKVFSFFYREEILIDLLMDMIKNHIGKISGEQELLEVKPVVVDIPEFLVFPYCAAK